MNFTNLILKKWMDAGKREQILRCTLMMDVGTAQVLNCLTKIPLASFVVQCQHTGTASLQSEPKETF